ncbi:NUDIX hydrolase [Pseudonocardia saturnea]
MTPALAVAAVALLSALVALGVGRVRRLHRLHARTDAARAGLDAALRRRAAVAAEIATGAGSRTSSGPAGPRGCAEPGTAREPAVGLGAAAAAALGARGVDGAREVVENVLGRHLAALDRTALPAGPRSELAEAERLVVLGRSVYHDAVRDTLALRSRRMVRWLRLAGTAPLPAYLDIAVTPDSTGNAAAPADVASDDRRSLT